MHTTFVENSSINLDEKFAFLEAPNNDVILQKLGCSFLETSDGKKFAISPISLGRSCVKLGKSMNTGENVIIKERGPTYLNEVNVLSSLGKLRGHVTIHDNQSIIVEELAYAGKYTDLYSSGMNLL
jgi:hypothetical protein